MRLGQERIDFVSFSVECQRVCTYFRRHHLLAAHCANIDDLLPQDHRWPRKGARIADAASVPLLEFFGRYSVFCKQTAALTEIRLGVL